MSVKTQLPAVEQEWHDDLMVAAVRFFEEDDEGFEAFVNWFNSFVKGRYENASEFELWKFHGAPFGAGPAGWWRRSAK